MSVLYRDLGVTPRLVNMRHSLAPPPPPPSLGPASPLSEDFQVISENRLLASINMRHPEPRLPPSYHTLNSREVDTNPINIYHNNDQYRSHDFDVSFIKRLTRGRVILTPEPPFSCSVQAAVTRRALTVTPRPLIPLSLQFCPDMEPVIRWASSLLLYPGTGQQTSTGSLPLCPLSLPGCGPH